MTEQEIIEKAKKAVAMGSVLSLEACIAFLTKKEAGAAKRAKRSKKGFAERALKETFVFAAPRDIAEMNRENAMKNLPSSLR